METIPDVSQYQPGRKCRAILWGGLVAGVLDLAYNFVSVSLRGFSPIVVPQAIASGLLGMKSFHGGGPTAVLGVGLEFLITFVATAIYYGASGKLTFLIQRAVIFGLLYGVAIYFFMHKIVVPLSAAPKFIHTPLTVALGFAVHLFLIGLPIALAVRRYPPVQNVKAG